MLIAGPAAATSTIPKRGLRSRATSTGTGLAQPNITSTRPETRSCEISSNPGTSSVQNRDEAEPH